MNSKAIRFASALLAALTAAMSFAACGAESGSETPADTTAAGAVIEETTAEITTSATAVPADTDFGGQTINVLNCTYFSTDSYYFGAQEATGDIVNDAIYERNLAVSNAINVNFNNIESCMDLESPKSRVEKSVLAGSNDYDFIFGIQFDEVPLVLNGIYLNIAGAPYIDISQPWWSDDYIREITIGSNKLYFLAGDISIGHIRHQSCAYVNKQVYENLIGNPDDIYKTVLDGQWTLDVFASMAEKSYADLNGDSKSNEADQFGAGVITANLTDHFTFDAGVRVTERDENDIPILVMNNERTVGYVEKIQKIYYENPGIHIFSPDYTSLHEKIPNKFKNNEMLFMLGWFYISDYLRDMQSDYAVIPFPKYNEAQESYLSLIHDVSTLVCVPATCDKLEIVAAALELLAYEGYSTVAPAYYEVALKTKYIRDSQEAAIQVMDIIHDAATTDFAYIYNYALNGIGLIMREVLSSKKSDFVSKYTKKEAKTQTLLDELVEVYTSLD